ncbi:MAG: S24 family peptidase [Halofilum sp. (in: g-proteobacteria)]
MLKGPEGFAIRLKEAAQRVGGQVELARLSGVPKGTLASYAQGGSEPNVQRLAALAEAAGVNVQWLVFGDGEACSEHAAPYRRSAREEELELIPQLDVEASARTGQPVDLTVDRSPLAFRRAWLRRRGLAPESTRLVAVRGDSMEPTLSEGDSILVDTAITGIRDDAIYVIRAGQELLQVKRLQRDYIGGVWIISDNPAYEDMHLGPEKAGQLEIVGRVTWIARNV